MEITSIFGVQSGFDSATVVERLIALQARPIDLKLAQLETKETELEAFQNLRTQLQTFQSALSTIKTASQFSANTTNFTVTAGAGSVLSATTDSSAVPGTHNITVNSLAEATTLLSDTGFATAGTQVAAGPPDSYFVRIDIEGAITDVSIGNMATVQEIVDAINLSGVDVTASVIDDGLMTPTSIRIGIQGNQVGTANTVTTEIFSDPPPPGPMNPPASFLTFTPTVTEADADVTVDGSNFIRSSNTISDIIPGVTLNLESLGSGTLTITSNNSANTGNIQDFVDAFNTLTDFIDEQTEFNPETFATATLFGNSSVQNLETNLRRIATGQVTGGVNFEFLSQIGITTQSDGTLLLDEVKLNDALTTDFTNVVDLFTATNGVITQLDTEISILLDSSQQGPLSSELDSITKSIDDLNDTLLRMDERLELFEKKIRQEFINLEIILGQLDAQRNAFQQALQNLGSAFDQ